MYSCVRFTVSQDETAALVGARNVKLSATLNCCTRGGRELTRDERLLSSECAERTAKIVSFGAVCVAPRMKILKLASITLLRPIFAALEWLNTG